MRKIPALFCLLLALPAQADDKELYDPAPPADSAYLRVVDGQAATITDYRILHAGDAVKLVEAKGKSFALKAGNYYSLLLPAAELKQDDALANPAKARVYFYNLSDVADASVTSPDHGNAAIVKAVAPGNSASREVNALTLKLRVMAAEKEVETFDPLTLERRRGVSLLLTGSKPDYRAVLVKNAVAR